MSFLDVLVGCAVDCFGIAFDDIFFALSVAQTEVHTGSLASASTSAVGVIELREGDRSAIDLLSGWLFVDRCAFYILEVFLARIISLAEAFTKLYNSWSSKLIEAFSIRVRVL